MDTTIPKDVGISKFYTNTNKKEKKSQKTNHEPSEFQITNQSNRESSTVSVLYRRWPPPSAVVHFYLVYY